MEPVVLVDPAKEVRSHHEQEDVLSIKHQIDLWIRKVIGMILSSTEPNKRGETAKLLASLKKTYLSNSRRDKGDVEFNLIAAQKNFISYLQTNGFSVDEPRVLPL